MYTALRIKLSSHVSITHLSSLKVHTCMFLKTAGKAINTNSELSSSYSCVQLCMKAEGRHFGMTQSEVN